MGKLLEDRRENTGNDCPGTRAVALEAGRYDEQMGENMLLTRACFSRFSTKSRPDMGVRWSQEGGGGNVSVFHSSLA